MDNLPVKVIRSRRRKKTVSARMSNGEVVIQIPAGMSKREEHEWVDKMRVKLARKTGKNIKSDDFLRQQAQALNKRFFDGKLKVHSITYSDRQRKRHGSCNTLTCDIRISRKLTNLPDWVLDYLIVHELAHLVHADHSKEFWTLVNQYRYAERARGFLIARDMEEWDGA